MSMLHRLGAPLLLAGAWWLLAAAPPALVLDAPVARWLTRLVVILFAVTVLVEAARAAGPRLAPRLATPRGAAGFALVALASGALLAFISGVIVRDPALSGHAHHMAALGWTTGIAYGPLAVWPAVQLVIPTWGLVAHVTLGRMLLLAVTALLFAALLLVFRAPRARPASWLSAAVPAGLAHGACPGCLPPLLAALALAMPAVAPATRAMTRPGSLASLAVELAAPLLALALLTRASGRVESPARGPLPLALGVAAPMVAAPLMQMQLAFAGFPRGASTTQAMLYDFFILVTIAALLLMAPVIWLVVYYPWRYRARAGSAPPAGSPLTGRTKRWLIGIYTVVPGIIILALGLVSVGVLVEMETPPEGTIHVQVQGSQFNWTFIMPDNTTTVNELEVPVDEVVVLHVSSADVAHSFYVPELGFQMHAYPNHENVIWFRATRAGEYAAMCAEYCGVHHTLMRGVVRVV